MIPGFKPMEGAKNKKPSGVSSSEFWRGKQKKGISCILLNPLVYTWRPRRDLNPCRRRERPILSVL